MLRMMLHIMIHIVPPLAASASCRQVAVLVAVFAVAAARPDKPATLEEGYQYQQPAQTFSAGQYQHPQRSYEAPRQSDEARKESYESLEQSYAVPSVPTASYAAPKSEESEEFEVSSNLVSVLSFCLGMKDGKKRYFEFESTLDDF